MSARSRLPAAALAALALAGCGGDDGGSDREKAEAAANDYLSALRAGDAEGLCGSMTVEAQDTFARQRRANSCVDAARREFDGPQGAVTKQIAAQAKVKDVKVTDMRATAQLESQGGISVSFQLEKHGADWKVSQLPT